MIVKVVKHLRSLVDSQVDFNNFIDHALTIDSDLIDKEQR